MRPRLLDLFCGAGGAAMGYSRAGFDVVGVDIKPQPNYPFAFIRADALEIGFGGFDVLHASPPCQAFTTMSNRWRGTGGAADRHSDLIAATRDVLIDSGLPYVLENVAGAAGRMRTSLLLSGQMFGLNIHRPRLFESNMLLLTGGPSWTNGREVGVYGEKPDGRWLNKRKDGTIQHAAKSLAEASEAMGIDWMDWRELCEAIPPAYTELIGHQLMQHLKAVAA